MGPCKADPEQARYVIHPKINPKRPTMLSGNLVARDESRSSDDAGWPALAL
jgi:hypothetical protein